MNTAEWKEVTIPLKHHVVLPSGEIITALTLREPNGEALEQIDELGVAPGASPNVKQTLGMIRAIARVDKTVTDNLHRDDIALVVDALVPLLVGSESSQA